MYISGRERKIVELLLQSTLGVSIEEIGSRLEVSGRTVHRDLKNVENLLEGYQLTLIRQQGSGIEIKGKTESKQRLQRDLMQVKYTDFIPAERRAMILLVLLEKNDPVKLYYLATKLHVTEATISNDLDLIEEELNGLDLQLIRRRGYGIRLVGEETGKRSLISSLIKRFIADTDVLSLFTMDESIIDKRDSITIADRLLGLINPNKLQLIEREVENLKSTLPYGIADSAYIGLVVHLALVVQRLEQGEEIQFNTNHIEQIINTKEYKIAKKMVLQLEERLELTIPETEISYIAMHILGAKLQIDHNYLMDDESLGIANQARKLIVFVSEFYGKDLTNNYGLLSGLVAHLKPALFRLNKNMTITNPIIEEIKQNYSELFDLIKGGVKKIFPEVDFPETEIGFLVLHLGAVLLKTDSELELRALVICPSGIGTAKMLGEKLLRKLPEIKEVINVSYFDLVDEQIDAYDLIVSTIPLKNHEDYILASPILSLNDIQRIKQAINRKKISNYTFKAKRENFKVSREKNNIVTNIEAMQSYSSLILEILHGFFVGKLTTYSTVEEVVIDICQQLFNKEIIDTKSQVVEDLLARHKSGGLGIPETSLALFHARTSGVKQINFIIFTLPKIIRMNGMDEEEMEVKQILLMISPENSSKEAMEVLSYLSSLLIKDEVSISLFEEAIETKIHGYLSEQYYLFLNDKLDQGAN